MSLYAQMSQSQLQALLSELQAEYQGYQRKELSLDMSRGKPEVRQLDLSLGMLDDEDSRSNFLAQDGTDCRNYGLLDGIPEAKRLMAGILDVEPAEVLVGGNSSLNMMYDSIARAMLFGVVGSERPWGQEPVVKFLCPSPGYDRHFAITEHFGIEMITVPMNSDGPDMDVVEKLVASDSAIKGIWCVPKYSNPQGVTYSDEVVARFAALSPAAPDFRIFWDNAYAVHHLYDDKTDTLLPLLAELKKTGKENMAFLFCSTSKITFPGAGVAAMGASAENLAQIKSVLFYQTIGHDKLNQLRHVSFLKDAKGIHSQMQKHAQILRPKFEMVLKTLSQELEGTGAASWITPIGGYFISLDVMKGCAKRVVQLCKEAGVVLTPAGATYPYGKDPDDSNIRLAPTYPPTDALELAAKLCCLCVKIACLEKLLAA